MALSSQKTFLGKWGLSILMVLVIIGTFTYGFYKRSQFRKDHVYLELKAIPVGSGWGYDILQDGHPWCHQDYVPAVSGFRVFRTKEDALAAGKIVYDKAVAGQLPDITEAEMRNKGIYIPPYDSTIKPPADWSVRVKDSTGAK
ncbi:DUF4907 domain-containing protein [Puia dinghuensis]|uniref:DUF4907 domain-containing protein n=1 Tax=Puia dinghuensis TaxID=1792502 RepID=A0A8J2XRM6_9BACT|nr:DUF4907 domain-containing protein [Puia dinghuensis]GGA89597.1 hypothetical protein GCM10011511_11030 [Puia dinghuensis]